MKISQRFNLERTQAEIDFVDIDTDVDMPLYIDAQLIAASGHIFANECYTSIHGFFSHFIELLRTNRQLEARALFAHLHEPNETCFGVSTGTPSGRGIGGKQADTLFESIRQSGAVETGVLEHLEDCAIFVRGIERDKVSDMTTNIIRRNLITYTQRQAELHGIPLRAATPSGALWDNASRRWIFAHTDMLVVDERPILLVPKGFVSYAKTYNLQKYHTHFVLNFIKQEQLRTNGPFVHRRMRRNGTERVWVSKEELEEEIAPAEKEFVAGFTSQHGAVFERFKEWAKEKARPLSPSELRSTDNIADIALFLADTLATIAPGNDGASQYHRLVVGILEFLFFPSLTCPIKEREIHEGRKRIDITFDNSARGGIFWSLHQVHQIPCQYIMVECKNYGREIGNPEIDQLSGRFSVNRGKIGMLLCRSLEDRPRLIERCRDTYRDERGLLLPVTDENLSMLLRAKAEAPSSRPEEMMLNNLVREIILA